MFSPNTIIRIYVAPRDKHTYEYLHKWTTAYKQAWSRGKIIGIHEHKIMENHRRQSRGYKSKIDILGWIPNTNEHGMATQHVKDEAFYCDVTGDPYYDYARMITKKEFDVWGEEWVVSPERKKKLPLRNKNIRSSAMLDPSYHFRSNSMMHRLYAENMGYFDAFMLPQTFDNLESPRKTILEFIRNIRDNKDGETVENAYDDAVLWTGKLIQTNQKIYSVASSSMDFRMQMKFFNVYQHKKIREMMPLNINFWFLEELLRMNPNMSVFVIGPNNKLKRIQGMVSKRDQNVIVRMHRFFDHHISFDHDYSTVYSISRETLIDTTAGSKKVTDLKRSGESFKNQMYGYVGLDVLFRYNSEVFYDLILEGTEEDDGLIGWYDVYYNLWKSQNYSNPINLVGKTVIL